MSFITEALRTPPRSRSLPPFRATPLGSGFGRVGLRASEFSKFYW